MRIRTFRFRRGAFTAAAFCLVFLPVAAAIAEAGGAARIFASSNQSFAQGTVKAGANAIRESRKVVYFNEDLTDLVLGYANFVVGPTGEQNGGQGDVRVKFSLEYQGTFFPFLTKGERLAPCADGATFATDPLPVSIKGGTYGAIRMWEQKARPDPRTNHWLWSTEGDPAFNEGSVTHSDPDRDWTLGGAPGETAALAWTVDSSGMVTPKITEAGSGITTSGVIIGLLDSQRQGRGFGYIGTVKSGRLAGWFQHNGGAGYSQEVWIGPSGMGGYGGGGPVQTHGPCIVAGTPARPGKSVLLLGDSIGAGFGSSDKRGDIRRNFGIYARALSKKYNVCNAAIPGLTAYACDYRSARTRDLIHSILQPQVVLIGLGSNDIDQSVDDSRSKTPFEALRGHLASIASWWTTHCSSEIWFATILPRVKLESRAEQPAAAQSIRPGFEAGGNADRINTAMRDHLLFPASTQIIDGRALVQDPADPAQWRTDQGALTDDGTHPSDGNGIPWIAARLRIPVP
ncbi:MAG: GDSL-like Lipase/Acylhydrolase family [Chthoniobacter sp.]|jgi:lysophospholipase L1-like esterase|nr:GDSL-like Lipase/Acylhydrolase family [Chthoniobacter sp.]